MISRIASSSAPRAVWQRPGVVDVSQRLTFALRALRCFRCVILIVARALEALADPRGMGRGSTARVVTGGSTVGARFQHTSPELDP